MFVRDSYVQFLNQNGYNPIAVPRPSIQPLSVLLNVEHDRVKKVGHLAHYLNGAFPPPEMDATDEYVSWASGKGTDRLQASVGLPFLSQVLARVGGDGSSLSASLDRASGVEIAFGKVLHDGVGINSLRLLLEQSEPTKSPSLGKDIDNPGSAYLVTDILKSSEFVVKAYRNAGTSATGKVGSAVDASIGSSHEEVEEHTVHRDEPLPFAFRAVGFFAYDGKFKVDLADEALVLMGPRSGTPGKYPVFAPGAFLELP